MSYKITSDYDSHTKDELLAEAQSRNIQSVNAGTLKADIAAALELDDESRENAQVSAKATPEENTDLANASNIPESRHANAEAEQSNTERPPLSAYKGSYTHKKDGDVYALAIVNDDPRGRTHKALNKAKFWEGNADEFDATFSKD